MSNPRNLENYLAGEIKLYDLIVAHGAEILQVLPESKLSSDNFWSQEFITLQKYGLSEEELIQILLDNQKMYYKNKTVQQALAAMGNAIGYKTFLVDFKKIKKYADKEKIAIGRQMYLHMTTIDLEALQSIPPDLKNDREILLQALKKNAAQLKFVPDELKESFIDELGVINLLKNNLLVYEHIPRDEKYLKIMNEYLSKIKYVIVTLTNDNEVQDIASVYANKSRRGDYSAQIKCNYHRTDSTPSDRKSADILRNLEKIFSKLAEYKDNDNIHLVLCAHHETGMNSSLGPLKNQYIAKLCQSQKQIKHVDLCTCSSAEGLQASKEEMAMIKAYSEQYQAMLIEHEKNPAALQTLIYKNDDTPTEENFRGFCKKFKVNQVYVISKDNQNQYRLHILALDQDIFTRKIYHIHENKLEKMQFFLRYTKLKNTFTGSELKLDQQDFQIAKLSLDDLNELQDFSHASNRFEPEHPEFKEDKTKIPFLAKFTIDEKMLPENSRMKNLFNELKKVNLEHPVHVQGYVNFLEVDTKTNYLTSVSQHIYHLDANYSATLYGSGKSEVDPKKLALDRKTKINRMREKPGDKPGPSMAKKVKITVEPASKENPDKPDDTNKQKLK